MIVAGKRPRRSAIWADREALELRGNDARARPRGGARPPGRFQRVTRCPAQARTLPLWIGVSVALTSHMRARPAHPVYSARCTTPRRCVRSTRPDPEPAFGVWVRPRGQLGPTSSRRRVRHCDGSSSVRRRENVRVMCELPEGESDRENVRYWALKIGRLRTVRSRPKSALGQRVGARCLCTPGIAADLDPAYLLILIALAVDPGHPVMMTSRRL